MTTNDTKPSRAERLETAQAFAYQHDIGWSDENGIRSLYKLMLTVTDRAVESGADPDSPWMSEMFIVVIGLAGRIRDLAKATEDES